MRCGKCPSKTSRLTIGCVRALWQCARESWRFGKRARLWLRGNDAGSGTTSHALLGCERARQRRLFWVDLERGMVDPELVMEIFARVREKGRSARVAGHDQVSRERCLGRA